MTPNKFEGLPYHTMPLVDGSSVRARLANEKERLSQFQRAGQ